MTWNQCLVSVVSMPQFDFEMMFEKKHPNQCHVQSILSINHMSYMSMLEGTIVMDGPSKFDHMCYGTAS